MKRKKHVGIDRLKSSYGRRFVLIWEIGLLIFVIVPILQTLRYAVSEVWAGDSGLEMSFIGLENFKNAINVDTFFLDYMNSSLATLLYSVPSILVISLVIAIILNRQFVGRTFFRTMYFLPVIIATGVVMGLIMRCTSPSLGGAAGVDPNQKNEMINVAEIMSWLNLSGGFVTYFQKAINGIFSLVWSSGIQIVLFIAGMQSIPDTMYEVSKVEGATKWEEFWFITLPMLSNVIVLVIVFTIVELVNDKTNKVMSYIYSLMAALRYSDSSAMLWIYFAITGVIIAVVLGAFNRFCARRWQ